MTFSEIIVIVGGLFLGYVVMRTLIGKANKRNSAASSEKDKPNFSSQQRSYQGKQQSTSHESKSDEYNEFNERESVRVFSCPSCKQRIRVKLPLQKGAGRCTNCNNRYSIYVDDYDNLYISETHENKDQEQQINTIIECFSILGLLNNASPMDIKTAYRKKMKEYHPDKVAHLGEKLKLIADLETKKLNAAYSMLKDMGYVKNA